MTSLLGRLIAVAGVSLALGCSIHVVESDHPKKSDPAAGGEATAKADDQAAKPKAKKKKKKPAPAKEEKPEPKPDAPKPKPKPKPEVAKPDVPKPDAPTPKPEAEKPAPKPEQPKPEPAVEPPAPQPEESKIVLPVKVAIAAIEQELEALVPKTDSKDWTQVTKGDSSPKAEIKYELWRDAIKVELEDHTFHITVPVRYAATVRAQLKNPLKSKDWFWIAKSETWGTREEPQVLTAHFDAKVSVEDDWRIKSEIKLVKLEHGDAPSGKICKNVGIEVCVPKSSVASEVHDGIDKRLEPKLQKALEKLDGKIEKAFDLQKRATAVWNALQEPQQISRTPEDLWLLVRTSAIGVGQPKLDGSDVRVDLAVAGRLSVERGAEPKLERQPLPKITKVEGKPGFHVIATLHLPPATLSARLKRALEGLSVDAKGKAHPITDVEVIAQADRDHPRRIAARLALGGEQLEISGDLAFDAASQRLAVENIELSPASQQLLRGKLASVDLAALRKKLAAKAHWNLSDDSAPLSAGIAAVLDSKLHGQASVKGKLEQLDVQKLEMTAAGLDAKVILGGTLEVEVNGR